MSPRPFVLALLASLLLTPAASAQQLPLAADFTAPGVTGYDSTIPTPEEVIGHVIGTRHTRPEQVVRYVEAVAAASPRVTLGEHGRTWEGRPLIHAIVAAPGTDLDAARRANVQLSDAPGSVSDAALGAQPVVAYMGYSVHGNEASGTEAALLLLYHLAAGQGPAVEDVLDNAVVLIDPMLNPDGRDRFVDWVNGNRGGTEGLPSLDGQDREHDEPWPGGRTNHYLFDLNRDWLLMQHPESQGRMALWHSWRPQLSTDFHEMGGDATFFFQPGIPSRNNPNTPAATFDLTGEIATYHARALDRIGSLYYSSESFDDFYYGKGSTYPDVNGGVGILFEQASSRALAAETANGRLDYGATVRNQFATSLSSLEAAVAMRVKLLQHQRDFYAGASDFARAADVRGYVFGLDGDRARAEAFAALLARHRVRAHDLARSVEVDGDRFEPGAAFVVPVDQPQARLIKAMMERVTTFEDSLFYDVSTWTLPLAFGVRHAELSRDPGALLGAEWTPSQREGRQAGGRAGYAYLIPWGQTFAPRTLARLQRAGVRVRLAKDPFEAAVGGARQRFERGTLVVPVEQGDAEAETVHALVAAATQDHVEVFALGGGLTPSGPDLGSGSVPVLTMPRVALLSGEGTDSYSVGQAWHLLTERAGLPVSLLDITKLSRADLGRYTVLAVVGSVRGLDEVAAETLKTWVRSGGTLIVTEGAAGVAAERGLIELDKREADEDSTLRPYAEVSDARGAQVIGGSIFEATLDTSHPLAFGQGERVALFKNNTVLFDPSAKAGTNVAVYTEAPLLSGYISAPNLERLGGAAAIVGQRLGRGRVVAFDFDPNFRAFWWGTQGLFLNAVFFGGAF
ncbi:MAG: M14 family metallopeptidase [Rhodothermales bacterium]